MEPYQENAIRNIARDCRNELIKATFGKPKSAHDTIKKPILKHYAAKLKAFGLPKFSEAMWLNYYVMKIDKERCQ